MFYPNEEIIRFVSKHVAKQIDLDRFVPRGEFSHSPIRWLDLGCGIGRLVVYGHALGCDVYGIDLSATAIEFARRWARAINLPDVESHLLVGGANELPWQDGFFDVVVSHGVLDSMPIEIATAAVQEVARVLAKGGKFYCDLIASAESLAATSIPGEVVVTKTHEQGTIQSYFNREKLDQLLSPHFAFLDLMLVSRQDVLKGSVGHRFHAALEPKG